MIYTNPGYDPEHWIERTSEPACDFCNDCDDGCDECDPLPESEGGEPD